MKWVAVTFLALLMHADEDFITKDEYASQLYNNPRGISCAHCHGLNGEGRKIATYRHDDKTLVFAGPDIRNIDFYRLKKILSKRVRGMPRYFLTDEEIKTLYYFLKEENQNDIK